MAVIAMRLQDDPRCQSGACISFAKRLYEVVDLRASRGGLRVVWELRVIDCMSPADDPDYVWLKEQQIEFAQLVRPAPAVEDAVPA